MAKSRIQLIGEKVGGFINRYNYVIPLVLIAVLSAIDLRSGMIMFAVLVLYWGLGKIASMLQEFLRRRFPDWLSSAERSALDAAFVWMLLLCVLFTTLAFLRDANPIAISVRESWPESVGVVSAFTWFAIVAAAVAVPYAAFRLIQGFSRRRTLYRRVDGAYVWLEWHGGERSSAEDPSAPGGAWDSAGDSDDGGGDGGGGD